ncbi:hypothetical protein [Microvirga brassicacearum]|uniref:hypothetical protein n=1 Tax=Microvirga brassicacearum TaxID=2580413 RepID=UPI0012938D1F|nr:hypothetical protein [Microvirga brassicacearum]
MPHSHHPHHDAGSNTHHAVAGQPTFSLLRLSAWERLAGSAMLLGGLWLLVFLVLA